MTVIKSKICVFCGKEYTKVKNILTSKFCSQYCGLKNWRKNNREWNIRIKKSWRRKHGVLEKGSVEHRARMSKIGMGKMLGSKHPRWKGGNQGESKLERMRFITLVQKKVFERDNYTCTFCGVRGKNLQVDHIQPWSKYIELRFDMNNCRTLCQRCHYQVTFGKEMPEDVKTWGHNLKLLERERVKI